MSDYFLDTNVILNYCHEFERYNEISRELIDENRVHCSEISLRELGEVKEYNKWIYRTILRAINRASVTDRKLFDGGWLYGSICAGTRISTKKYGYVKDLMEFSLQKARKNGGAPDRKKLVAALNQTMGEIAAYAKQASSRITAVPIVSDTVLEAKLCGTIPDAEVNDCKIVSEAGCWFNNGTHPSGECFVSHDWEHIVKQRDRIVQLIETHFNGKFRFNLKSLSELNFGT